ncbi:MAG: alpha/beta hydrolase, partial [Deltaproteobacteria bacterium]|nr:alpha/beta hydrolase [Deltaproteobacteria bacterium]
GPHEDEARRAEEQGNGDKAKEHYLKAYNYLRIARYPTTNSKGKRAAYLRCNENYLKASRYFDPSMERVEMPFHGRPGEGNSIVGLLQKPSAPTPLPVLVTWGGIDTFKEDRRGTPYLQRGIAMLAIDMPGIGEAPIHGSEDAERMWDCIFDWIERRSDLDAGRVGVLGLSTGGYWATKLAHTHKDRIRAAINHGGCAHFAFQKEWIEKSQHGEYPFEFAETLASAFGLETFEQWVEYAPKLSLLNQGILERPCTSLLCVNGLLDSTFPIQDHYLLLEHGQPKTARFYPGGHMGHTPKTIPTMANWIAEALSR